MPSREWKILGAFVAVFALAYSLPLSSPRVTGAILEAFKMVQWYARNHTLACVVPALFIAGAIITFLSQAAVVRHLGPTASRVEAYSVAAVSGTVLAVCSCSVLPMFAGIYRMGAGLGPAAAFLYAGPAINVLAVFLTARVLGFELGVARAVGAIGFGIAIGLIMAGLFRHRPGEGSAVAALQGDLPRERRPLWQTALFFAAMMAFLVFSDWYNPGNATVRTREGAELPVVILQETRDELVVQLERPVPGHAVGDRIALAKGEVAAIDEAQTWVMDVYHAKWPLAGLMGLAVLLMAWRWLERDEVEEWLSNTWDFTKLLVPLLFGGVFAVGFLGELVPQERVAAWVGDESLRSTAIAAVVGCLFYFATLTEIPILQALIENGMARGPSLALLLAGPALSLPSLLVIRSVMGTSRTAAFTVLVIAMATMAGWGYGRL